MYRHRCWLIRYDLVPYEVASLELGVQHVDFLHGQGRSGNWQHNHSREPTSVD